MTALLTAAEAATRLGVSPKALRLYEQRGLLCPARSEAGWRAYGPADMDRAREVVALRALGLSLAQVSDVISGDAAALAPALAAHQQALEAQLRGLSATLEAVRALRAEGAATAATLPGLLPAGPSVSFPLPWPWGGEVFTVSNIPALTFLTGPLGSGKTRLARALAEALGGAFLGLDRPAPEDAPPVLDWLLGEGAADSPALRAVLAAIAAAPGALVIDLVEDGLDAATQTALATWLRRRPPTAAPLVVMTRSTALLDLDAASPADSILFCPANHAPPQRVLPIPGAAGYEALASCLAPPEVRARVAVKDRPGGSPNSRAWSRENCDALS